MNWTRVLLLDVLVSFAALTVWCLVEVGLIGLVDAATANAATITLTVDLLIALALTCTWMVRDARKHNRKAAPYVALTLTTGSIGPLLYLVLRQPTPQPTRRAAAATQA